MKRRTDKACRDKENDTNRQRRCGINVEDCINKFHEQIKLGPVFVCSCCHQTWFKESVLKVEGTKLGNEMKSKFLTGTLSVEHAEWICNTCYASIRENKTQSCLS